MPTRNVVLTDRHEEVIERLVKSGRYQNASEVLRDGLRLIERRDAFEAAKLAALKEAARIGFQEAQILFTGRCERMIHRVPAALVRVPAEQRKIGDPHRLPGRRIDEVQFIAEEQPQPAEHIVYDRRRVGAE